MLALLLLACWAQDAAAAAPVVELRGDNVPLTSSARVVVPAGAGPLVDLDGDGVLQIRGDDLSVDLTGAHLHGAAPGAAPDSFAGTGIRITGRNVTLRGARVSGYRIGIHAADAPGLVLEDCDASGNFRQRLHSTPAAEDERDWLWPHDNDAGEWRAKYGAAILIERSEGAQVRRCRAREGQNGLVLERCQRAQVCDNDFSFLSGWGIALWRTSESTIARNALDFCVRGYSHGVYNRGQDSAGLLLFEQCSGNVIAQNSITHGGDGIFGFAGKQALELATPEGQPPRAGCNDNLFWRNDLSYAAAHGLELTFSFGNVILENRFVGNAICGLWGGYSQDTLVQLNTFEHNGEAGYGLERGGVNIEHSKRNAVVDNRFTRNRAGVHLWWDEDPGLRDLPWVRAHGGECALNLVRGNSFSGDELGIHLRGCADTVVVGNSFVEVGEALRAEAGHQEGAPMLEPDFAFDAFALDAGLPGATRPVGARAALRGREHIVITEWGPYDWRGPLLARAADRAGAHVWRLLGDARVEAVEVSAGAALEREEHDGTPHLVIRTEPGRDVVAYTLRARTSSGAVEAAGLLVAARWEVTFFGWSVDPRQDAAAWRAQAAGAPTASLPELRLRYGASGPSELGGMPEALRAAGLPRERFGTLARADVRLPAGRWQLRVTSDDGVRVWADEQLLVDVWTHHGPRLDTAELDIEEERVVRLRVEHFELDGHAVLELELAPLAAATRR